MSLLLIFLNLVEVRWFVLTWHEYDRLLIFNLWIVKVIKYKKKDIKKLNKKLKLSRVEDKKIKKKKN